jgi:hypothetical protein
LTVTEAIRVQAEGNQIRRGIYRDFPTRYQDPLGNHYTVGFSVEAVLRDGVPESWHGEELPNGIRVYAGSADHLPSPASTPIPCVSVPTGNWVSLPATMSCTGT